MSYLASDIYGGAPSPQPTATPSPTHAGGPEPMARTVARGAPGFNNPTLLLVVLIGLAALLINFSVKVDIRG